MKKPLHIAIIMDGNGRWAREKGLPRYRGHQEGVKVLKRITRKAGEMGIKSLTVYAFSTENWKRPGKEVNFLMRLFRKTIENQIEELDNNNVKVKIIGRRERLPSALNRAINRIENKTLKNTGLNLNIAFNYGGRAEICDMLKSFIADYKKNDNKMVDVDNLLDKINEKNLKKYLYNSDVPEIEMLIRTGGEKRLSNYLLWQSAYAELYFVDKYWPDFTEEDFIKAVKVFGNRERKFGGLKKNKYSRKKDGE